MNFGLRDGLDLFIYDKKNNLIATIDYLNLAKLDQDRLIINSQIVSEELFNILYKQDNIIQPLFRKIFTLNKKPFKTEYKIIAETNYACEQNGESYKFQYEIPRVKIVKRPTFVHRPVGEPANFTVVFKILPFNRKKELYKINIIEK